MSVLLHTLDILGAIFAFLSTVFYVKADIRARPIGIVATLLDTILYGCTGIYGDMALSSIYFLSMFYGWHQWLRHDAEQQELPITHIHWRLLLVFSFVAILGIFCVVKLLTHFTNSQVPYLDATTTVLSLIAQWMICKKIIETWALWFFVDAIYVGLYFYKGIPAHSVLLIIYLGMAAAGYFQWKKLMSNQTVIFIAAHDKQLSVPS